MKFSFELLTASNYGAAVDCITETFVQGEPMLNALGVTRTEFRYFSELFISKAVKEEMSFVVKQDRQVAAAVINEDLFGQPPEGLWMLSEKLGPVMDILEKLDNLYITEDMQKTGECFHIFMGGVFKKFEGKSIAANMVIKSQEIAKEKGFKHIIVEATGNTSHRIMEHNPDFFEAGRIPYKSYTFQGKKVFSDIRNASDCVLFVSHVK